MDNQKYNSRKLYKISRHCPCFTFGCDCTCVQAYYGCVYWFRVVFIHLIPCSVLVVLTVLLVGTLRRAQQRKRRLLQPQSSCRLADAQADDQQNTIGSRLRRRRRSRNPTEGSSTTAMLVTVVGVFLAVELPLAVTLILLIAQYTFSLEIFERDTSAVATLVCNLVVLLSYPTNFFVYCAMSRAFRSTFTELFCGSSLRGSAEKRMTTTDAPLAPIGQRCTMKTEASPVSKQFTNRDDDGNVTKALVNECRDDEVLEVIEEQHEICL